jgi:hypothetical protein
MRKDEWSVYSASLVFAVQYGELYIGFMTAGGFVLDTKTGDFSTHNVTATAGWYEREEGRLFLVVSGAIVEWAAGSTKKTFTWKSKRFRMSAPTNFGAAKIYADGPVTLKVYADNVLKHTEIQSVASKNSFRLPSGFTSTEWELEVLGNCEITSITMASSASELAT